MKDFNIKVSALFFVLLLSSQVLSFKLKEESRSLKDKAKNEVQSHSRQRRGATAAFLKFLVVSATVASVGTLSYSLYLEANGCCKESKPHFCDKQKELAGFHDKWLTMAEEINDLALEGSMKVTHIQSIHAENERIRTKLVAVIRNLDNLVATLFDADMIELIKLQDQIEQIYRDNKDNMQTWTVDDFNIKYQGVWGDPKGMALLFGPVMYELGSHGLSKFMKWNRMRKISKTVSADLQASILKNSGSQQIKAYKLLQASSYSQTKLIKQTTIAQYKASYETGGKVRGYFGAGFSAIVMAFEIWHAFELKKACNEVREQVDKNHAVFDEQLKNLTDSKVLVEAADVEIKEDYDLLTKSISSDEFLAGIESIEDLVRSGSTQNQQTKDDADAIKMFRDGIVNAVATNNNEAITELQTKLSDSLGRIEYHYDCLLGKANAIREILTSCKAGRDALDVLYEEKKKNLASCIIADDGSTPPYLSYTDVETAIKEDAGKYNYYENCRLNNENLKKLVCTEYCEKYPSTSEIEASYTLTSDEVTTLCGNYLCELTESEKKTICLFKSIGQDVNFATQLISESKKAAAIAHYDSC